MTVFTETSYSMAHYMKTKCYFTSWLSLVNFFRTCLQLVSQTVDIRRFVWPSTKIATQYQVSELTSLRQIVRLSNYDLNRRANCFLQDFALIKKACNEKMIELLHLKVGPFT